MPHIRRLTPIAAIAIVVWASVWLVACAPSSTDAPHSEPEYAATVQVLLPTAEPTEPPPTQTNTPAASTTDPSPVPTDTPTAMAPTYTPRPLPTYTPRPTPPQAGDTERSPAVPFQAQTLDGSLLSLPDTYGTPTLLAFWAPW